MPTEIVFSGGEKLRVEMSGSELVGKLAYPGSTGEFQGAYLNVQVEDGRFVWVNPTAVAYVRDA